MKSIIRLKSAAVCEKGQALHGLWLLTPDFVFLDEPSAGLDPVSSARLDELILQLRDSLGMTIIIVTHELASIFAVANNAVWLDAQSKTMLAEGNPHELLKHGPEAVRKFLKREAG